MLRRISLTLLFVIVTGTAWWLVSTLQYQPRPAKQPKTIRPGPNHYMEDFSAVTMDDDGLPKHRLNATYMAHYPGSDTTELTQPNFVYHQRAQNKTWTVDADQGTVFANGDEVLLTGNVKIVEKDTESDITQITTDVLRILPDYDYAESDEPVKIVQGDSVVDAVGIKFYLKREVLVLKSKVRGVYVPKS